MKRIPVFFVLILFVLASCTRKPAQEQITVNNEPIKILLSKLPPPLEVSARLQATGAEYNPAILSNADMAAMIAMETNKNKVAANLGFYLSDLGYAINYKQSEDAAKYFHAASMLADSLGLKKDLLGYLIKRYDQNLTNNDSVKTVLVDFYNNSTNSIEGTDAISLRGIVASAMYLETLHSLLAIIETYPKEMIPDNAKNIILAPVFKLVLAQKDNVKAVQEYVQTTVTNGEKADFYNNAFNELIEIYDRLQIEDKIANNKIEELMNDSVVQQLIFRVENIRNEVMKHAGM